MGPLPQGAQYRIFDAQTHLASDRLPEYRPGPHLRTLYAVNSADQLLSLLDENGIDMALVGTPCLVTGGAQEFLDPNHE